MSQGRVRPSGTSSGADSLRNSAPLPDSCSMSGPPPSPCHQAPPPAPARVHRRPAAGAHASYTVSHPPSPLAKVKALSAAGLPLYVCVCFPTESHPSIVPRASVCNACGIRVPRPRLPPGLCRFVDRLPLPLVFHRSSGSPCRTACPNVCRPNPVCVSFCMAFQNEVCPRVGPSVRTRRCGIGGGIQTCSALGAIDAKGEEQHENKRLKRKVSEERTWKTVDCSGPMSQCVNELVPSVIRLLVSGSIW